LPLIGALAIDIAGDVVVYRALGVALVNGGSFHMELTGGAIGYLIVYVLYSFVAGIRPYKPVEDSKNTFTQP
jgi:biotin transporter BioY